MLVPINKTLSNVTLHYSLSFKNDSIFIKQQIHKHGHKHYIVTLYSVISITF